MVWRNCSHLSESVVCVPPQIIIHATIAKTVRIDMIPSQISIRINPCFIYLFSLFPVIWLQRYTFFCIYASVPGFFFLLFLLSALE